MCTSWLVLPVFGELVCSNISLPYFFLHKPHQGAACGSPRLLNKQLFLELYLPQKRYVITLHYIAVNNYAYLHPYTRDSLCF